MTYAAAVRRHEMATAGAARVRVSGPCPAAGTWSPIATLGHFNGQKHVRPRRTPVSTP